MRLEFGTLPERVSEGTTGETTVHIGDDDDPRVTAEFGADSYAVAEGGTRAVTVTLSADPERTVAIPVVVAANQGGATSADYSGLPASVTFSSGETSKSFTFMATQDTEDDDGESVKLGFGDAAGEGVGGGHRRDHGEHRRRRRSPRNRAVRRRHLRRRRGRDAIRDGHPQRGPRAHRCHTGRRRPPTRAGQPPPTTPAFRRA